MKRILTCIALVVFTVLLAVSASAATIEIDTADELSLLMQGDSAYPWNGDYVLTDDIDMTGKTQKPIGNTTTAFSGTFDGDGHTVSGLNLSGAGRVALFGKINSATIKNLTVSGTVTSSANCLAGLVAEAVISATIENCVNKCTVTGTNKAIAAAGIVGYIRAIDSGITITNCTNEGNITAERALGGIVGWIIEGSATDVTISKCSNSGAIKSTVVVTSSSTTSDGDMADVGGILGVAGAHSSNKVAAGAGKVKLSQCLNSGAVEGYFYIGGIVGRMWGNDSSMTNAKHVVSECWNNGTITSLRTNGRAHVGGIIGYVNKVGNVYDCLNTGVVKGITDGIGGLFGSSGGYIGAKNCLNKTPVVSNTGAHDYVNSIGGYMPTRPADICYYTGTLQGKAWDNGKGTLASVQYTPDKFSTLNENGVWTNASSPELTYFAASHTHNYNSFADNEDGTHTAACSCGEKDPSATPVAHTFDAMGNCVCGAEIDLSVITTAEQLLILMNNDKFWTNGAYTLGGNINLASYTGTLTQKPIGTKEIPFAGSFDGKNYTVSGLAISESGDGVGLFGWVGDATVKNLTVAGSVSGGKYVGGIVGSVGTTSAGKEATFVNCHNTATVSGAAQVGGIIGYFHGKSGASITGSTNSGYVTSTGDDVGGIAGIFWEVTASNCTNSAAVTGGNNKVGGIVGRATGNLTLSGLTNSGNVSATKGYAGGIVGDLMNTPGTTLSSSTNSGKITGITAIGGIVGNMQLRNTTSDNAIIQTCTNNGAVEASEDYAGGILGNMHAQTSFTTVIGTSNAATLKQNKNTASVSGRQYIGGIVGAYRGADTANAAAKSVITECYNSGAVTSAGDDVGGIAGLLQGVGDVNNSLNTGAVHTSTKYAGGFVGRTAAYVNIAKCYADCTVTTDASSSTYVRAFCGYPLAKQMNNCFFNAAKCSNEATNESEFNAAGGATPKAYTVAVFDALNGDGKWLAKLAPDLILFHTHNANFSIDNGDGTHTLICACEDESTRGDSVAHSFNTYGFCACGASTVLEISSANQLVALMQDSNAWASNYKLTANINLSGKTQNPIGNATTPFTGTFDGNGYTISNLNVSGETNIGLFGVAQNAEIRNLTVSGKATATGYYAGGIVAYAGLRNGTANTFIIENCVSKVTVKGARYVGGVVGYFVGSDTATNGKTDSVLRNCANTGKVTATSTTEASEVGGIAGIIWNVGEVSNCYSVGNVVASGANAGGVVGRTTGNVNFYNNFANAKVTGTADAYAFCGNSGATGETYACYYNPAKTADDSAAFGARAYGATAFVYLNEDGLWIDMDTVAELILAHTHNNKLAWVDLGAEGHAPICPCGDASTKGTVSAHTVDMYGVCTVCGNADNCTHAKTEIYVDGTPNCQTDVLSWERCVFCQTKLTADGEETVIAASDDYHAFAWTVADGVAVLGCTVEGCGVEEETPATVTELFVSPAGTAFGGYSEDEPINDFDVAMQIAAVQPNAVTVYLVGSVAIPYSTAPLSYYEYLEPAHENVITVRGMEGTSGVLEFRDVDKEMIYGLNGPTVFENLEFSFGSTMQYLYLTARHYPLVLGEGVSTDFHRVEGSGGKHSGLIYVIGGCYESHFADSCTGGDNDLTVLSGTYRTIIGGSYSGKNCGTSCNISLKLLGDITTREQITSGSVGATTGDIDITIGGNLAIGTFFTFGGQGTTAKANKTTVRLMNGSITLNSFHGGFDLMSTHTIGATDAAHNVLDYTKSVTVYTDATNGAAMALRGAIFASFYSAPNLANDFASKVTFLFMDADTYCAATGGAHTPTGAATVEPSTCTVQGYETYYCSSCESEYITVLPLAAHVHDASMAVTVPATCIAPEMVKNICTECGAPDVQVVGGAFGAHTEPVGGFCQLCNADLSAECEHASATTETITVGCGTGTKWYCADCDKTVVDLVSDGHSYGKYTVTVEPTATMAGVKTRKCKVCGKVESAMLQADEALNSTAMATDASGALADLAVASSKLTKAEKAAINALLQQDAYGSEIKVSYETDGTTVTGITYYLPVPAAYTEYDNVMIVVKDDAGKIHFVDFRIEKGYLVFNF